MEHRASRRWFLLGALSLGAPAAAQVLHITRDPDGKVNVTDQPPPGSTYERQPAAQRPPSPPRDTREQPRAAEPRAPAYAPVATDGVVLFAAHWCGYCRQAKAYLAARGIPYVEYNVDTREGKAAMASVTPNRSIPYLVAGKRRQSGFSVASYDAFFAPRRRGG